MATSTPLTFLVCVCTQNWGHRSNPSCLSLSLSLSLSSPPPLQILPDQTKTRSHVVSRSETIIRRFNNRYIQMFLLYYCSIVTLNMSMLPMPWLPSSLDANQYFQYSFRQKFEINVPVAIGSRYCLVQYHLYECLQYSFVIAALIIAFHRTTLLICQDLKNSKKLTRTGIM